jgi:hypothetical protein
VLVERGKIVFSRGVVLKSGGLIGFKSLCVIARDTLAVFVEVAEQE